MLLLGLLIVVTFSSLSLFIVVGAPAASLFDSDVYPGMSTTPCGVRDRSYRAGAKDVVGRVAFPAFAACVLQADGETAGGNFTAGAANCGRNDEILALRDSLNTLNFAYFPLREGSISYNRVNVDGTTVRATARHPVEPILYYTSRMYTGIGDEGDAALETDGGASLSVTSLYNVALFREVRALLSSDTLTEDGPTTWEQYFANPGPGGDGTANTWSIPSDQELYYSPHTLQSDEQFWRRGSRPRQTDTLLGAVGRLLRIQLSDIKGRYVKLLATGKSARVGEPRLWSNTILNTFDGETFDNVDTFHKVRKALRTTARVIEMYPDVLTASNVDIPDDVLKYLGVVEHDDDKDNAKDKTKTTTTTTLTYKDVLCLKGAAACPARPLSYLLYLDDQSAFPLTWWGLDSSSYLSLRAIVLLKTSGVGSYQSETSLPHGLLNRKGPVSSSRASFCPSDYYVDGQKPSATYVPPTPPPYVRPVLVDGKLGGTYCNVDKYMGDVHDAMVVYQKNEAEHLTPTIEQMGNYIKDVVMGIELMLKNETAIYTELSGGLCRQMHASPSQPANPLR